MSDYKPFSEREGFVPMKVYQVDTIDAETRVKIYNEIYDFLHPANDPYDDNDRAWRAADQAWNIVYQHHCWTEFLSKPVDEYKEVSFNTSLKGMLIRDDPWHRVFDFVEYLLELCTHTYEYEDLNYIFNKQRGKSLTSAINRVSEKSKVGYKIIDNIFAPISSESEAQEVEIACNTAFHEANQHIKKAIRLFADRKEPDYENSIKESISAVESIAKEVTKKETKALNALTQSLHLHPNFKNALNEFYNWTSKDGGIRHGATGRSLAPDQNTARFMLVVCSSFVNYIISRNPRKRGR